MLDYCIKDGRGEEDLVSHLLFADDTLIILRCPYYEMAYLSWILLWFEATPGLRINPEEKVQIFLFEELRMLRTIGCKVGTLPTRIWGSTRVRYSFTFSKTKKKLGKKDQKHIKNINTFLFVKFVVSSSLSQF